MLLHRFFIVQVNLRLFLFSIIIIINFYIKKKKKLENKTFLTPICDYIRIK